MIFILVFLGTDLWSAERMPFLAEPPAIPPAREQVGDRVDKLRHEGVFAKSVAPSYGPGG
jgi:hypothetical protein